MIAHRGLLNDKIAHVKDSFQIKSIPLWNIPFRYFWTYQLSYEFDNWLLNPWKKYWNLVECKRKHLIRFHFYFNFVYSLLNTIRRLKLDSSWQVCNNNQKLVSTQSLLFYLKSGIYCIKWSLFFLMAGSKKNNKIWPFLYVTKVRRTLHITQKIKPYIYCPFRYVNRLV